MIEQQELKPFRADIRQLTNGAFMRAVGDRVRHSRSRLHRAQRDAQHGRAAWRAAFHYGQHVQDFTRRSQSLKGQSPQIRRPQSDDSDIVLHSRCLCDWHNSRLLAHLRHCQAAVRARAITPSPCGGFSLRTDSIIAPAADIFSASLL